MALLVDTSVWSLALRRDAPSDLPEVQELHRALTDVDAVASTGMVLLELLRGFVPDRSRAVIRQAFDAIALVEPTRADYEAAAELATTCRARGVQLGSVDALIAALTAGGGHVLLTTDRDFHLAAEHVDLRVWSPGGSPGAPPVR